MKLFPFLFFIFLITNASAQDIKKYELDSIALIDSLFNDHYPFQYNWIQKNKKELYISHRINVYDSTRQHQNLFRDVIDTVNISCLHDSTLLNKFLEIYNVDSYEFVRLIKLIEENNIYEIKPAGPGDCSWCSTYIFISTSKAFVFLNENGHCYPEDCFWRPQKSKSRKLKKDIYLVRNINNYH